MSADPPATPQRVAPPPDPERTEAPAGAKPERADKARNRTRILQAAAAVFADRGIDAQMDEIAAHAGVGVGTLYRHFATKDALMRAMVERKFELILEVTQRAIDHGEGEPFEVFADTLREGATVASADAATQDVLVHMHEGMVNGEYPTLTRLTQATAVLVDRAHAAGTLRADVRAEDVAMIMCGVSAVMAVPQWDWRHYLEILLDGLRTPISH